MEAFSCTVIDLPAIVDDSQCRFVSHYTTTQRMHRNERAPLVVHEKFELGRQQAPDRPGERPGRRQGDALAQIRTDAAGESNAESAGQRQDERKQDRRLCAHCMCPRRMSAAEADKLRDVMNEMTEQIRALGPARLEVPLEVYAPEPREEVTVS